ncbi:hypothetical protein V3C99_018530 [Haemonchus contortus]
MSVVSKLHQVNLLLSYSTLYKLDVRPLPRLIEPLMAPRDLRTALRELLHDVRLSTIPVHTGVLIEMYRLEHLVLSAQLYSPKLSSGYYLLNTRLGKIIAGRR